MKKGFASMYMVYSLFLVFILMMLTVLLVNNYKTNFLNILKTDIKEELRGYDLEVKTENNSLNVLDDGKSLDLDWFNAF